jgi:hypothetical protein
MKSQNQQVRAVRNYFQWSAQVWSDYYGCYVFIPETEHKQPDGAIARAHIWLGTYPVIEVGNHTCQTIESAYGEPS